MEYYIVLNPIDDSHNLEAFKTILDNYKDVQAYCISFEISDDDVQHYHLYIKTELTAKTLRQRFLRTFKCRSRFSSKEIQDRIRAIAYTIKDGNYFQKNLNVHEFLMAVQVSHPKKPKFEVALRSIDEEYIAGNIDFEKYLVRVLTLYKDYRRKLYRQHIIAHATTVRLEASPQYLYDLAKNLSQEFYYL